jgi:hypothetical protein
MTKKLSLMFIICVLLTDLAWAGAYDSTVLADNPLGYWRFEDASGSDGSSCADSAAGGLSPGVYRNRYQGTPNDIPDIALVPGKWGQAAEFHGTWGDGYGNFVQIYDSNYSTVPYRLESSPSCTIEFWENANATEEETYGRFVSHASGGTANYWIGMATAGGSPGQPFVGVPGTTWYAWPPILADANWHHVVLTYTYNDPNTTAELWIDAISRGTMEVPGQLTPPGDWQDLLIGAENNPYWVFNGLQGMMDEVAYYDYVLGQDRIEAHYNVPEPATIALLSLGGLALLRRKR